MEKKTESANKKYGSTEIKLEAYDWIQCVISALVVGILIFMFAARTVRVKGSSMYPTLHNSDMLVTSNLFFTPEYGDIVVFQTDSYGQEALVKRVIATEGQTVDIDFINGIVYVDGNALDEPYTNTPTNIPEDFSGPVTVPENHVFVLGDNRNASSDSRYGDIGTVDVRCIIGKVYLNILPAADETGRRDLHRIGSVYN